jgi:hypothetical protein
MEPFQFSVFYHGYYLSYVVTSEDVVLFHFALKSAPDGTVYAPAAFTVSHTHPNWKFDPELDADFEKSVINALNKTKA